MPDRVIGAAAPFVSVIVPVYGAASGLAACLDRLAAQTYPRDRYEVVVVDNGAPAVDALTTGRAVRLVREGRPGSYAARNRGIREARGDVLAFTDDDCVPGPDWIADGVGALTAPGATGIVAGVVAIGPRPASVSRATYAYSAVFSFRGDTDGPTYGATANLFVRRDLFDQVGMFDETLFSGGDWVWGWNAEQQGVATRFHPEVRVLHQVRPTVRSIVKRELRLAGGMQMRRERPESAWKRVGVAYEVVRGELIRQLPWALGLVWREATGVTAIERVQVTGIVVLVQVLRVAERLRVAGGGLARRA